MQTEFGIHHRLESCVPHRPIFNNFSPTKVEENGSLFTPVAVFRKDRIFYLKYYDRLKEGGKCLIQKQFKPGLLDKAKVLASEIKFTFLVVPLKTSQQV